GYDFAGMLIIWWSDPTVDAPVPAQPTDISPDGVVSTLQPTLGGTYTNHHPDAGRGAVLFTVTDPTGALVTVAATTPTWSGLHNDTTPDWADLQWGVTYTLRAWSVARFHDEPGWEPLITDLFFEPANASPPVTTTFTPSPVALDGVADSDVVFATETLDVTTQLGTIEAVDYHANGVPIATNEPNSIAWDTTSIDDGPVELTATVTLDDTTTWDTQPITVYVDNTTTTAIDRVELDHERGLIDLDTYAEHLVRAALGRHGLPDRYQPPAPSDPDEQVWRSGTVPLATMLAFDFDHLQAATQDLIDDLLGNDPPGSLDSPQQGGGSTSDANCLHPDQEGALLRNPDGAGWIDACNIVGEWDDPDLPVYDISFRVRSDGDGPSNDPRGVDPTPSVDDPSVPQQIYEYLAVIEASLLTFRDAGYDVSMPAPAGLGPNGYFFIEVADLSSASAAGTVRETRGMYVITLDPATAKGYAAIHEVFHLMQFTAAADTTSVDRDTYGWALESTAMYAEAYYGTLPGSPLADLSTTISRPTAFGSKGWSDPPEALRVYPSLWQAPAFSLTAEAPPRLSRVAGWANSPESNWNWGRRRHYSGGIFWQYLAEQVDDPAADIDIVFDFWDGIADENGTIDYFADILTPLVATYDIDLPDALRDFWVAIHLLDTDNNDIDRFAWQLPSSNPTRWRGSGDYGLGGALPAGDMGDGFGKDYRRLMSPSRLPVGTFETSRVVTFLSSSIPTVESGRISSGGAWVYDLEIGDFAPGSLDVTVDTDSPHVAATLIAYDSDGHPTICVRGAAPEIEQRNNAGALSVDLDHDCTDASLIITHTDPTPDTELVHFRATITHTWGGVTAVPVNFFTLEAAPLNGLHASTWIRVVRPSLGIFTGQIVKNGIEFTVHTGTAGPSGSVEYRLHFDDNMSEVVNAPPHSASTTRVGVSGYPFGTTTAITRIDVLSGHIDSWDAVAYREWAI
ncbi:MAG: hypothetical protein JJU45_18425, partial [Acidimicrobiia bacterium]|nr:hypothetical protein [Acidimicrobiia bacterium]